MRKGKLITFSGLDGAGKSTQIKLLADWLRSQGRQVTVTREPGGTPLGEHLRDLLLHRSEIDLNLTAEMLLYMASRAQLVSEVIEPALHAGQVVIADRYLLANVVYQGFAGGLGEQTVWEVGRMATQGRMPDLTLLLDLEVAVAQARLTGQPDRLESRGLPYMQRVRSGFLAQARKLKEPCEVLDANASPAAIHQRVVELVGPLCEAL